MTKVTANKFLDLVRRSGLVDESRLAACLERIGADQGAASLDDQDRLADTLVDAKLLTRWQADKLLAGKHKGFRLGKYKLLGQIGKGGMSSVYLGEHEMMKRRVAIKVLPQNRVGDSSYLERFRLEARAVAKLDDPNIVRAYDIDNEGNIHYIVMEYVDGQDLHQIVHQDGPLDYDTAADYIAQVANGLSHAHQMGLVHRDIKPANCLVDRNQTVKLLDLGLAKVTEDEGSLTMANEENVLGTADYLAPEQALNSHQADNRSDIYSLGCTLYFLLTGGPPFREGSISERLLKHQTTKPESILRIRPDAPPSLVDICERMMAKKPEERFQSAGDVAQRLTEWLADRGRKLGGGHIESAEEGSGIGSGIFSRYGVSVAPPSSGKAASSSGRVVSSAGRDTQKLDQQSTGGGVPEEDIGLAPLDEEDVLGVAQRKSPDVTSSGAGLESLGDLATSGDVGVIGPPSGKSLIEEELHDPEMEAIKRRMMERAKYNPLQPPGFVPPNRGVPLGVWLLIGGITIAVIALVLSLVLTGS
jgi:serine/threonine protein kinase